ncbi:MAG: alkaline phosphatase D family protein [Thermoplasmatota archaeon]
MQSIDRRAFLRAAGAAVAAGAISQAVPWTRLPLFEPGASSDDDLIFRTDTDVPSDRVFPQSVASGDPTPTGFVLWTRIDPEQAKRRHPVGVQIATDPEMRDVVYQGVIPGDAVQEASDFTVRFDTDGLLASGQAYHYRFLYGGTPSRIGRARTLPAADARVEEVKLALVTCQNFQNGYWGAYGHIAEENVDFIVHLGDMIYEYNGQESYNGKHFPGRGLELPSGAPRMETKEDLTYMWTMHRSDVHMMQALESHTMIATWDDHEVANDRYFDHDAGHHMGDEGFRLNDDPAALDRFFRDAAAAYFHWLPLRIPIDPEAEDPLQAITLYRRFTFGDLLDLWMLDERWYRTTPPSLAGITEPDQEKVSPFSEKRIDPDATMLGLPQREWLLDGLAGSRATWKSLGQQVQMSPLAATLPGASVFLNLDAWDGYEAERQILAEALGAVDNTIVLTGDLHSYMVGYVKKDYNAQTPEPEGNRVAVEFMTPGMTSAGLGEILEEETGIGVFPGQDELIEDLALVGNPHMRMFNSSRHGYATVTFTPNTATYAAFVVDKATDAVKNNKQLIAVYNVPAGSNRITEAYRSSPSGLAAAEANDLVRNADPRREGALAAPDDARHRADGWQAVGAALRKDREAREGVAAWLKGAKRLRVLSEVRL